MADIFLKIFNMSVSACWIVLAVILFRAVLKKAPKWVNCVLWGIAGLRLVLPFSFESILSLIPSAEFVPQELIHSNSSVDVSGTEIFNYVGNNPVSYDLGISNGSVVFTEITAPEGNYVNPLLIITSIAAIVWAVGIIALLIYTLVSFLRLRSKIGTAVLLKDNIYQSENISSPFVLGVIKPKIYLPFYMNERDIPPVVAHEKAHIQRKDYLWKPLGFLILTLHWFNPLVWLGYVLLCRDIELACDEKVVKKLNNEQRADYSQALLTCSVNRRMIAACPLAFGEVGVKDRVKSILNYKKPAFWVIVTAVVLCLALAVGFLTNPVNHYVYNSRYETGKCLYNYVVSADKETENNELVFDITSDGKVYKTYGDGTTDELGVLKESDYTSETLKEALKNQDEKLNIGNIKNAYELSNYIFLQKSNGTVYLVSLFSDGKIMSVFKLKRTGDCDPLKSDFEKFTWNYQPMLSHTAYSFYSFSFDTEYTHIVASCDNGKMKNLEADKQPEDKTLRFEKGQHVYWTPDEGVIENIPLVSKVTFRVFNEDEEIYTSTVIFECLSRDIASAEFAIYLAQSDGLRLFEKDGLLYLSESASSSDSAEANTLEEYEATVSYANWAEVSDLYSGALNSNKMYISSVQHLPVYKFDTLEDFEGFRNAFADKLTMDSGWDEVPSFNDATAKYDKAFFEENTIVLVYVSANNSTHRFAVNSVYCENNSLCIHIEETTKAEVTDCAMAGWFVTVAVSDEDIVNVTQFDADLNNIAGTDTNKLRLKYPQYFDVSTDGGLTVYVWQMAENNYRCHLANTALEALSDNSFIYTTGATIEEMKIILSSYDIGREDITIQPVINPISSYYYEIDEAYKEKIKKLFWGDTAVIYPEYDGKSIPRLHISCNDITVKAVTGTLTWTSEAGNGKMQTICADGSLPLAQLDSLLSSALNIPQTDSPLKAQLDFDITPNKITVNSWYIDENGKNEEFEAETDGSIIILNNDNRTCVYEIIAEWNSSKKYYGTVRYSFCVVADDTDKNGEYVLYGNDDQYILVHKDNTYGSFEQSYSIGQSVRLRHSDISTRGNTDPHNNAIYDYNVTVEKVLTGDTAKQFVKENCTNFDEEEFLFEDNELYLARVNIEYNPESEISNHKPVDIYMSAVDSEGNYVATENRLDFSDYRNRTENSELRNWYAVFVPKGTDAKLAFVIGSLFEAPGAVAAVLFDTNSEKTDIVNSSQFVESSAAAYYNLLYSDNSDLATAIKQITKQTSDKALLRNEVSVALGKIKALLPDTFSEAAKEYMAAKLFYYSVGLVLNDEYGQITSSDFVVAEQKEVNGYLVCKVNCTVYYRTSKHGSDAFTASKSREQLQIVVKNTEKPVVIDCYNEGKTSSFDMSIRTYGLDLYESKNWLDKTDKNTLSEKLTDTCIGVFERFVITQAN